MKVCYRKLTFMDFPGYRVGTDGSVWTRIKTRGRKKGRGVESYLSSEWKRLTPIPSSRKKNKYLVVTLRNGTVKKNFAIHRLVLEAFDGPCPKGMEACHYPDLDHTNNRKTNLMWGTRQTNHDHQKEQGTRREGEKHGMSVLTKRKVRKIRRLYGKKSKKTGKKWTKRRLAKRFCCSENTIHRAANRVTYQNVH